MKKVAKSLSLVALLVSAISLVGCNDESGTSEGELTAVEAAVKDAETLTRDELMAKAADELNSNTLKWVGCSSRAAKGVAGFAKELQKHNPTVKDEAVACDVLTDGRIYTKLVQDIKANNKNGYDAALVQDGYQLSLYGDNFVNYVPKEWTGDESSKKPFALQYNFKTWLVNDAEGNATIPTNVWQFLETGKVIQTMNPAEENVNRDWMIMLTNDENNAVLKNAYEKLTDAQKASLNVNVEDYAEEYGEKKYAYAFIKGYITNAIFSADDGAAQNAFAPKGSAGQYAWIVYSKMMNLKETDNISKSFIVSPALGKNNTDGKTATMNMDGFAGFMYKHYLQIMPTTNYPYTCCAFINYLSTTPEGYAAWAKDIGDYPTMESINVDRTKFGYYGKNENDELVQKNDGENLYPVMNDPSGSWWIETGKAVVEDPTYIGLHFFEVDEFINDAIASK